MPANLSPLAQTFKVSEAFPQGCYITSVDLYFAFKNTGETEPVEVQIVETLNGYPTENILNLAKSLVYPASITASTTAPVATKFTFPSLIYLEPNTEYAIKVMSNSTKYKVWTATMGQARVDNTAILITQQPALGSFFKSQNNSTWTAEQLQDLTFVLNRAKFNTNVLGNISLAELPRGEYVTLGPNPFRITNGQTAVKVKHVNHGLEAGMLVVYFNSTDTQFNAATGFTVSDVIDTDTYYITTASQASTNDVGGGAVITEKVVRFDTFKVEGFFEGRDYGIKAVARLSSDTVVDGADTEIQSEEYNTLDVNKYIHSSINKSTKLQGANSFTLKVQLSSVNDALSPMIDLNKLTVRLMSNKINTPSVSDVNYNVDGVTVVVGASNVSFSATTNLITVPGTTDYSQLKLGAWIQISGGTNDTKKGYIGAIDTVANTILLVGDTLITAASTSSSIIQYKSFISEIANGGTAESKHITKLVTLVKPAAGFRVILQMNIPSTTELEMYYRTGLKASASKLADTNWTKNLISYKKSTNETHFTEYEYNITDLAKFDEFQFKFVFLSSTTSATPKIKALRIIAHG